MATRALGLLLSCLLAGASGLLLGTHAATRLGRAALPAPLRPVQWARAGALLAMAEAEGEAEAEPAEPEAEPAPEAADEPAETKAAEPEADDLLSSPAFLKQKLKVLEKELVKLQEDTAVAKAEAAEQVDAFGDKRARLQTDFENFKARPAVGWQPVQRCQRMRVPTSAALPWQARQQASTLEAQLSSKVKVLEVRAGPTLPLPPPAQPPVFHNASGLVCPTQEFLPVLDNYDRARGLIQPEGSEQEAVVAQYQGLYVSAPRSKPMLRARLSRRRPPSPCTPSADAARAPSPSSGDADDGVVRHGREEDRDRRHRVRLQHPHGHLDRAFGRVRLLAVSVVHPA